MSETYWIPPALTADIDWYTEQRRDALAKAVAALSVADSFSSKLANALSNAEQFGAEGADAAGDLASEVRYLTEQLRELAARTR